MQVFKCDLCGEDSTPGQNIHFHRRSEKPLFGYFFLGRVAEEMGEGIVDRPHVDLRDVKPLDLCAACEKDIFNCVIKMVNRPKDENSE